MSNENQGKTRNPNWGGAREGAGRPKKTLKRTFTQLQTADSDSQPAPVPNGSGSATHSSFEPATGRSNVIQRTAKKLASTVTGFFVPSHHTELENTNSIAQLNKDLAVAAALEDEPEDLSERIFDESLGDEEAENDDSANAELAQTEAEVKDTMKIQLLGGHFPSTACLSSRGALDNHELDVMKATFSGRFGADPFSKMFSMFDDPQGFAGHAPSARYFKSMFTALFSAHRILMDRVMSSQSATIIKADHTYNTIDHQSCLPGGEPINVAMYSIVNSDEEVRAYAFTLTQSFPPLREVYERMQAELERHGHPPIRLLYTDNPRS
ncbi:hypothetical protein K438DRAFT_1773540 [Mycena galopus ATCC 62051]|nr:hypothetical protein K438DRAFT_1773540 [Mycena galopus ATCC 62051]